MMVATRVKVLALALDLLDQDTTQALDQDTTLDQDQDQDSVVDQDLDSVVDQDQDQDQDLDTNLVAPLLVDSNREVSNKVEQATPAVVETPVTLTPVPTKYKHMIFI